MKLLFSTFLLIQATWYQWMSCNAIRTALDAKNEGEPNGWWIRRARQLAAEACDELQQWRAITEQNALIAA